MPSLGNDLALIRKEQNLTLDDIQRATKIPKRILNSIEDDSIFSDFDESPTYIRSYVRTYAKALSIDEQKIVFALNKKQKHDYKGSLQQLLDQPKRKTFQLDEDAEDDSTSNNGEDEVDDYEKDAPVDDDFESKSSARPTESIPKKQSPDIRSIDWADMGRRFQPLESTKSKVWIGLLVLLIICTAGGYFYLNQADVVDPKTESNPDEQTSTVQSESETPPVTTDSLQLNIVPSAVNDTNSLTEQPSETESRQQPLTALPDTLGMVVYAAYDKLEPVRVYTDITDSINPYWIEQGNAVRFQFVNEIRIRGQFSRIALLFNGRAIPNITEQFYNSDTRLLEIERSFFEGDSTWLQPPPDSLSIDAPAPTNIQNRSSL